MVRFSASTRHRTGGFSLPELLLSVAILGMIAGLAIPFYQVFQVSSQLDNSANELAQTLQRAQERAMSSLDGQPAGVHLQPDSFTLFSGSVYNPVDSNNEVSDLPPTISLAQTTGVDVIFSQHLGETSSAGTISLTTSSNKQRILSINSLGVIDVE